MFRLCIFFMIAGLVFFPVVLADEEMNSTDEYTVCEYALISFSDEVSSGAMINNTPELKTDDGVGNQTRRGGEMTARKLFALKQAADEESEKGSNQSGVSSQSTSASCTGCTKTIGFGSFRFS